MAESAQGTISNQTEANQKKQRSQDQRVAWVEIKSKSEFM